jgi:hypothetical protein
VIPKKDWFTKMRESVGHVAFACAALAIASADWIVQFGFDETQIQREGTMNLWALIFNTEGNLQIITMETAGLMVGGTAREVGTHIKEHFRRMQAVVLLVRAALGEDADRLAPILNGGVQLLKILSAMHDTCHTANASAVRLELLKQENGKAIMGAAAWAAMDVSKRTMTDYLYGNHTRGLPVAAFNRLFEAYLTANLGDEFAAATTATGGRARLEKIWGAFVAEHV